MDTKANPYALQLAGRDAVEVAARTPKALEELAASLGASGMRRSLAPGKWAAREILCHLADCEIAFGFRLRQALADEHHVIQPFDQDSWAIPYAAAYDGLQAVAVFSALRHWNLSLIRSLDHASLSKPVNHPERGEMTVQTIVETMAGHDINHLKQLDAIAASAR